MQPDPKFRLKRIVVGAYVALLAVSLLPVGAFASRSSQAEPPVPPEPTAGRDIYLQNCAACHGETGDGDGPSAEGLSVNPASFSDPAVLGTLAPVEWFDVTKNGRMDRMMPPWGDRLTDQQIWDAVGYAWTLQTSPTQLAMGKAVYEANCVSCHGADGQGVPPQPDFTEFAITSQVSQDRWMLSVQDGKNEMPAFGNTLSAPERSAALEYVRSLSLGPMFGDTNLTGDGILSGIVTNGTTGSPMAGLNVEMAIFDDTSLLDQRMTQTDAAGVYRFVGLPTGADLVFATRAEYPAGVENDSAVAGFDPDQNELDVPLEVYETTTDGSGVRADRAHYIVEFQNGQALVAEVVVFSLEGDRTYVGNGDGVLRFTLPPGAQDLTFSDGELGGRYVATQDGFVDTLPLPPGQATRQLLYRYALPYSSGKLDLQRSLAYPATDVNALIADQGQRVSSEGMENQGIRQTQNGNYFNLLAQNVPANQPLMIHMSGLPAASATGGSAGTGATTGRILLIALAAIAVAGGILLAIWPLLRRRTQAAASVSGMASREELIEALAELERSYHSGDVSESVYRDQRLQLKAQLLDQVRKEGAR